MLRLRKRHFTCDDVHIDAKVPTDSESSSSRFECLWIEITFNWVNWYKTKMRLERVFCIYSIKTKRNQSTWCHMSDMEDNLMMRTTRANWICFFFFVFWNIIEWRTSIRSLGYLNCAMTLSCKAQTNEKCSCNPWIAPLALNN